MKRNILCAGLFAMLTLFCCECGLNHLSIGNIAFLYHVEDDNQIFSNTIDVFTSTHVMVVNLDDIDESALRMVT